MFGPKVKDSNEDLRGILNAGHGRNRPYKRWDVNSRKVENCPTFAMAAFAGIRSMPDTIEDRAVIITMRRRTAGETVAPFRVRRDRPALETLRDSLQRWMASRMGELENAEPDMPVDDREADTWEALVAVADAAAGDWPERARSALQIMCSAAGAADTDRSLGVRLLTDISDVFAGDAMHGETLVGELRKLDESPWGDYYGRELNQRDMAKLLARYGVKSVDVKLGGTNKKGLPP